MENRVRKERAGSEICSECTADATLPDYLGEVRKILSVKASAVPTENYREGESVHLCGTVNVSVLYADEEQKVNAHTFAMDYDVPTTVPEGTEAPDFFFTRVDGTVLRPAGPRKLHTKVSLSTYYPTFEETSLADAGLEQAQTLTEEAACRSVVTSETAEREYAFEIAPLPEEYGDAQVVSADTAVIFKDVKAKEGGVRIEGDLSVRVLLIAEGKMPLSIEKRNPIDEFIPMVGVSENSLARAFGYVTSVKNGIEDNGEGKTVVCDVYVEFAAIADANVECSLVTDAFVPGRSGECERTPVSFEKILCAKTVDVPISGRVPIPAEAAGLHDFLDAAVNLKIKQTEHKDGILSLQGECTLTYAANTVEGENCGVFSDHAVFPFSYEMKVPGEGGRVHAVLVGAHPRARLDGENILCECDGVLCVDVVCEEERVAVCALSDTVPLPEEEGVITVYYPAPTDTLWSVAKKFSVSPAALAAQNRMSAPPSAADATAPLPASPVFIHTLDA